MVAPPLEWFEKDFYWVLGVAPDATPREIIRAFRALARSCHPDAAPGDRQAEERFKALSTAFTVLRDPTRRAEYDLVRRSVAVATAWRSTGLAGVDGLGVSSNPWGSLDSDSTTPGAHADEHSPAHGAASAPRSGDEIERTVWLSSDDTRPGRLAVIDVVDDVVCPDCGGHGAAPGRSVQRCPMCAGEGTLPHDYGGFFLTGSCPTCFGRGRTVEQPCPGCHGGGITGRHREVRVRIPPGVTDGQRLRVHGQGGPGRDGGGPGDLYLTVRVHALQAETTDAPPPGR
jgi:molecular chaperone DnaJ